MAWIWRTALYGFGLGENGVMEFTEFGIESLMELIRMHKSGLLNR